MRHAPNEPHRYRLECVVCGQLGTIRLSIEPESVEATICRFVDDEIYCILPEGHAGPHGGYPSNEEGA